MSMSAATVLAGPVVEVQSVPIPAPLRGQILVRTIFASSNQKDCKRSTIYGQPPCNQGDDVAGIVHQIGAGVVGFSVGDRVAGFHNPGTEHGTDAEYTILWAYAAFHIPENVSFVEASTVPLTGTTAAVGLWRVLCVTEPWHAASQGGERNAIIIYGAGSAVGNFAIQLARLSNLHPIIAVAGKSISFVESQLDAQQGDRVVDYRGEESGIIERIRQALKEANTTANIAFDAISEGASQNILGAVLEKTGHIATVLPLQQATGRLADIKRTFTISPLVFTSPSETELNPSVNHWLAKTFFGFVELAMADGSLKGHPYEIIPGGLDGIQTGLEKLKNGNASALKYVYEISKA
ncbi:hypothetical protein LTR84_009553 [Exophiala bonariae]|uniref:Enoyl reductase (ER) domain-containing protein n=1 Tax=Exophiala bonariae TaxID=1690606 RepID=A0AAV9MUE6_9EURO|nr:hypothetical protein LTR84_009553 [Exophiala bonariae]